MKLIIGLCIFCIVLFVYLHIQFHLKTGEDLEIYELEDPSKEKLEEVCDLRQPVLFSLPLGDPLVQYTSRQYLSNQYNAFDLKLRNLEEDAPLYVPLPMQPTMSLLDSSANYCSEQNGDFLEESGVSKTFQYNDEFLRPSMMAQARYDVLMISPSAHTPFRYEVNYRNYFLVTQGSMKVQLSPPHSGKYLHPVYDYETFEFRSPINPWSPQSKYRADFQKTKCLECSVSAGSILYIPAYWWYSIRMEADSSVSCFYYRTYMNTLAISPYLGLHLLQMQNVKRTIAKTSSLATPTNLTQEQEHAESSPEQVQ